MPTPAELKTARINAGLEQQQAAEIFGVSQTSVSNMERGETKKIKPVYVLALEAWPHLPDEIKSRYLAALIE